MLTKGELEGIIDVKNRELRAKDAEIAALQDELSQEPGSLVVQLARANERIAALERERDELQRDYDSVGERLDERSEQLAAAETALREIYERGHRYSPYELARTYFTAKGEKP